MTHTPAIDWQTECLSAAEAAYRHFTRESVNALLAKAEAGTTTYKDLYLVLVDETNRASRAPLAS